MNNNKRIALITDIPIMVTLISLASIMISANTMKVVNTMSLTDIMRRVNTAKIGAKTSDAKRGDLLSTRFASKVGKLNRVGSA